MIICFKCRYTCASTKAHLALVARVLEVNLANGALATPRLSQNTWPSSASNPKTRRYYVLRAGREHRMQAAGGVGSMQAYDIALGALMLLDQHPWALTAVMQLREQAHSLALREARLLAACAGHENVVKLEHAFTTRSGQVYLIQVGCQAIRNAWEQCMGWMGS